MSAQQQRASSSGAPASTEPSSTPSGSGGQDGSDKFRIPYTMTAAYGEARFAELYDKALTRKKLFKEYLYRHAVLERLNAAIEALYDCEVLPEDPMDFIITQVKAPGPPTFLPGRTGAHQGTSIASGSSRPVSGGRGTTSSQQQY